MTFPPVRPADQWLRPVARIVQTTATGYNPQTYAALPLPSRALLTLWDPDTEQSVIFDPPPPEMRTSASSTSAEVTLSDFGSVSRVTGRAPTTYSWSGVFYGVRRYDTPIVFPSRWRAPNEWRWLLEEFHRLQALRTRPFELHLEGGDIPPFTKPVDITSLEFSYRGGSGDLAYSITLTEYRHVQVGVETHSQGEGETVTSDTTDTPSAIPQTVVVHADDTLHSLAQLYLDDGSRWTEIAELNNLTDDQVDYLPVGTVLTMPGGIPEANPLANDAGSVGYTNIDETA